MARHVALEVEPAPLAEDPDAGVLEAVVALDERGDARDDLLVVRYAFGRRQRPQSWQVVPFSARMWLCAFACAAV